MKCEACKFEFCWSCLGSYKSYVHDKTLQGECEQVNTLSYGTIFIIACLVYIKIQAMVNEKFPNVAVPELPNALVCLRACVLVDIWMIGAFVLICDRIPAMFGYRGR